MIRIQEMMVASPVAIFALACGGSDGGRPALERAGDAAAEAVEGAVEDAGQKAADGVDAASDELNKAIDPTQ